MRLFVTGTGTDVGKTIVSAALVRGLGLLGKKTAYWKPVQTGETYDRLTVSSWDPHAAVHAETFHFPLPASPDQAARAAGKAAPTIAALVKAMPSHDDHLVLEGAGGLLVPLNDAGETWGDFARAADLPLLLVAQAGLGTLNHTSLTLEAMERRGLTTIGVVLSGAVHPENEATLKKLHPKTRFFALAPVTSSDDDACRNLARFVLASREDAATRPLLRDDARHIWHPYTQHETVGEPVVVKRARGAWLETTSGERLLDATSSWWVNTLGHGRPEIGAAIARQQARLDHCIFAGATHEGAVRLARRLAAMTDDRLSRIFYSDNGSTSVEVALKIAMQSHVNQGDTGRDLVLGIEGGYHGDTFGAMAAAGGGIFHEPFRPFLFTPRLAKPVTRHPSTLCPDGAAGLGRGIEELDKIFATDGKRLAAAIVEPLVQGAGGMLMQDAAWLQHLARLCRRHGVPLIFDEVFTGLGRVGADFAFQKHADLTPDLVCIAKGLTGGTLPLAVTLATESLFEKFLGPTKRTAFLHGHSYTANPVGCAAALAALDIYEKEDVADQARALDDAFVAWTEQATKRHGILAPRVEGAILAFEWPQSGMGDYYTALADRIAATARTHGLFLRTLGNTVYAVPPLTLTNDERRFLLAGLDATLASLL